jgi:hypothetical protein
LEVVHVSGKIVFGLCAVGEVIGMGQLATNVLAGSMGNTPAITLGLGRKMAARWLPLILRCCLEAAFLFQLRFSVLE